MTPFVICPPLPDAHHRASDRYRSHAPCNRIKDPIWHHCRILFRPPLELTPRIHSHPFCSSIVPEYPPPPPSDDARVPLQSVTREPIYLQGWKRLTGMDDESQTARTGVDLDLHPRFDRMSYFRLIGGGEADLGLKVCGVIQREADSEYSMNLCITLLIQTCCLGKSSSPSRNLSVA